MKIKAANLSVPAFWVIGLIFVLIIGGIGGVPLSAVCLSPRYHDTYYIVLYFRYVGMWAAIFAFFVGWYYWLPRMYGVMYNEMIGKLHFGLTFISINFMFAFQVLFEGFQTTSRRIPSYTESFASWNLLFSSIGSYLFIVSILIFIYGVIEVFIRKRNLRHRD